MHVLNQESSLCFTVGFGVVPLKEWHQLGIAGLQRVSKTVSLLAKCLDKGGIQLVVCKRWEFYKLDWVVAPTYVPCCCVILV